MTHQKQAHVHIERVRVEAVIQERRNRGDVVVGARFVQRVINPGLGAREAGRVTLRQASNPLPLAPLRPHFFALRHQGPLFRHLAASGGLLQGKS